MKIVGWTHWDDLRFHDMDPLSQEESSQIKQLIARELRKKGYKFNGYYHQDGEFGVPVFNDGTVYQCTYRTWGEIVAMAYPEEVRDCPDGAEYVFWAWHHGEQKCVFPTWEQMVCDYRFTPAGSLI